MFSRPISLALLIAIVGTSAARAQVTVDVAKITCRQYLTSDAERQEMIAAWMSGYVRASTGQTVFDFQRFANNKRAVRNVCKKNGAVTVMSAIQRSSR